MIIMVLVYVLLLCALNIDAQHVPNPPSGAKYTSPDYRAVGENFTFTCVQIGSSTGIYLWNSTYKYPVDNSTITDPWLIYTDFEGALAPNFPAELKDRLTNDSDKQSNPKSWSVTVKYLQPKDFALYGCYNTRGSSQNTTVTKLRRFVPATSKLQLSCSYLQENSAGNCSCESTGANPAPHFRLRVDGTPVGNTTNQVLYVHRVGGGESRAVVEWTSVSRDIRELSCEVIGPTGTSWSQQTTRQLNVKYCTQSFKLNGEATDSVEMSREYGEDVKLRCEAAGSPQPVFKWFSDNQELFSTAGVLQLKNLTRNATYTCIAEQTAVIGCSQPRGVVKLTVHIDEPEEGGNAVPWAAVGGAVGGVVVIAGIVVVVIVFFRKRRGVTKRETNRDLLEDEQIQPYSEVNGTASSSRAVPIYSEPKRKGKQGENGAKSIPLYSQPKRKQPDVEEGENAYELNALPNAGKGKAKKKEKNKGGKKGKATGKEAAVYSNVGQVDVQYSNVKPTRREEMYTNVNAPKKLTDVIEDSAKEHKDWKENMDGLEYADVQTTRPARPENEEEPVHRTPDAAAYADLNFHHQEN